MSLLKPMRPAAHEIAGHRRATWAAGVLLVAAVLAGCASSGKDDLSGSPDKLYADAREDLNSGSYDKAIAALEKVEGRAAGTLLAQQAALDLAFAKWKSGERVEAIAKLDRFLRLYPSSPALDYALYLKGLVNFNENTGFLTSISRQNVFERDQQASRDSYQAFAQLVEQYPASKYSDDARLRMDYTINSLAEYEVHVARYYYRRQAFLAAANRAQLAVREYQRAPATEEALYIMAASYDKLGLPVLRDDTERILKSNFPNTQFFKNGVRLPDRAWWQFW